jgi:hypothetical protein
MLKASGCDKSAFMAHESKALRTHHHHVTSALSKLIFSAKIATGIWPPPDSVNKMRFQAGQVLLSIRHFVSSAQEAGLELREVYNQDKFDLKDTEFSDMEFVTRLDQFYTCAHRSNQRVLNMLMDNSRRESKSAFEQTKESVSVVGQLLSMLEDIPYNSENQTSMSLSDFRNKRDRVYRIVNDLVTLLQNVLAQPNVASTLRDVIIALEDSLHHLVTSSKLIVDERELIDQIYWQARIDNIDQEANNDSKLVVLQRRAMSLSLLPESSNQLSSSLQKLNISRIEDEEEHFEEHRDGSRKASSWGRSMSENYSRGRHEKDEEPMSADALTVSKAAKFFGEDGTYHQAEVNR